VPKAGGLFVIDIVPAPKTNVLGPAYGLAGVVTMPLLLYDEVRRKRRRRRSRRSRSRSRSRSGSRRRSRSRRRRRRGLRDRSRMKGSVARMRCCSGLVQGAGFRVQGSGCRVQGSGFR